MRSAQTYAPNSCSSRHKVNSRRWYTSKTSPDRQMNNVEIGKQTPHAINLGVVSVDLRHDEEDEAKSNRSCKSRDERVCIDIQLPQPGGVGNVVDDLSRQGVELGYEGLDSLCIVAAVLDGLEKRKSHYVTQEMRDKIVYACPGSVVLPLMF